MVEPEEDIREVRAAIDDGTVKSIMLQKSTEAAVKRDREKLAECQRQREAIHKALEHHYVLQARLVEQRDPL